MESSEANRPQSRGMPRASLKADPLSRTRIIFTSLVLAVTASLVIIPRPTFPQVLPLPEVDRQQLKKREAEETRRARSVADGSLSKELRAVGEQYRRLALASTSKRQPSKHLLKALRLDVRKLITKGETESLLNLRALQAEFFIQAVAKWESARLGADENNAPSPPVSRELKELGASFATFAEESWLNEEGRLVLNQDELRLLFRMHWGRLTGVHKSPLFGPSLEEFRRYYSIHLLHPLGKHSDPMSQPSAQLSVVSSLGRVDYLYPQQLAMGILFLRLGQADNAALSLGAHLHEHPNGSWANIARNHLGLAKLRQRNALLP